MWCLAQNAGPSLCQGSAQRCPGNVSPDRGNKADKDLSTFAMHSAFKDPYTLSDPSDRKSIVMQVAIVY